MGVRKAAVLGSPIAHSLSPVLHLAAYAELGLDWDYQAIEVDTETFDEFFAAARRDPDWAGFSVTMPCKVPALNAADIVTDVARLTGAANTLLLGPDGVTADNTDPIGIKYALSLAGVQDASNQQAAIIGAGATARSALAALSELGVGEVLLTARRPEAVEELFDYATEFELRARDIPWRDRDAALDADLVLSVLPAGVADPLALAVPEQPAVLLDVVYADWPTRLAEAWQICGGTVAGGLEMLVGQAARQVELMTGRPAPIDTMLAAGRAALNR